MKQFLRLDKLKTILSDVGEPAFRFNQITQAIFQQYIPMYTDISTIPLSLKEKLHQELGPVLTLTKIAEVKDAQVQKILFKTRDGRMIETVKLIYKPTKYRPTSHVALCVSSQVGCAMACTFCATGGIGFKRNLTADEIVDQYLYFKQHQENIDSIIFMGMGEPFANPEGVFEALRILTTKKLINLSPQRISISTIGVIPGITKLLSEYPQVNLAVSIHSPIPQERSRIMPINKTYPLEKVLVSIRQYIEHTHNKVFLSYLLLSGVNDSPSHAYKLVELINNFGDLSYLCHVNLIRYNPAPSKISYKRPSPETVRKFQNILAQNHISHTLRQDFGVNIDAACGQLWAKYSISH